MILCECVRDKSFMKALIKQSLGTDNKRKHILLDSIQQLNRIQSIFIESQCCRNLPTTKHSTMKNNKGRYCYRSVQTQKKTNKNKIQFNKNNRFLLLAAMLK